MSTVRLLLADDHNLFRQGLRRILEEQPGFEVVAEASSGLEAVALGKEHKPDIALLDVAMRELNGIEAAMQLSKASPGTAVIMLSMYSDERYVSRALRCGAKAYLVKDTVEEELIEAVRRVGAGEHYLSSSIAMLAPGTEGEFRVDDRYERLTERERQLYHLLAEGQSNKDIAGRLGLSLHTVETHRTRIMEKLGVHSIAELVLSAVRRGIIPTAEPLG